MYKTDYDRNQYPFKPLLEKILKMGALETISFDLDLLDRKRDQQTPIHPLFYAWARTEEFRNLYEAFLNQHIKPLYNNEEIVYQSIPTFRVAFPNNIAVGEFHKDRHYRDEVWAKKVMEDNFFLPFTDAFDTNTIWAESEEDKGDYLPMNCLYGQFIQWDASNLTHGNKMNTTGRTRMSIDFRVMPDSRYIPSNFGSINTKTKFKIGAYYSKM